MAGTSDTARTARARKADRRPSRRGFPLWAKLALSIGATLTVLSGTAIVATKLLIRQATSNIAQPTLIDDEAAAGDGAKNISGAVNLLLVGIDVRPGWSNGARSDTIMIAR